MHVALSKRWQGMGKLYTVGYCLDLIHLPTLPELHLVSEL